MSPNALSVEVQDRLDELARQGFGYHSWQWADNSYTAALFGCGYGGFVECGASTKDQAFRDVLRYFDNLPNKDEIIFENLLQMAHVA
jgi:hypothetical protein